MGLDFVWQDYLIILSTVCLALTYEIKEARSVLTSFGVGPLTPMILWMGIILCVTFLVPTGPYGFSMKTFALLGTWFVVCFWVTRAFVRNVTNNFTWRS